MITFLRYLVNGIILSWIVFALVTHNWVVLISTISVVFASIIMCGIALADRIE